MTTKVYIKTLGCEKNTVDSQCAAGLLEASGCAVVDDSAMADVILINTCGFINDAKQQSIEVIFDYINERISGQKIVVSGCLSQRYSKELAKEIPEVDFFLGVNDYSKLPEIVKGKASERVFANPCGRVFEETGPRRIDASCVSASLKIAEGCNNICSYCIIPFIRGRYRSRKPEDILAEAKQLVDNGIRELNIIAQNVTYYGRDFKKKNMLLELLQELCKLDKLEWLRLMYCYEDEITPELIELIKKEPKIVKYIDIPIQHCSDKILKAMNRKSTGASIRNTVSLLRKQIQDIVIRTTLITGFPGEDADDFNELYDFVSEMKFDRLGVFAYSQEEGTKAAEMKPQVRQDVKERRRDKIMELQRSISLENNNNYIGRTLRCLVEEDSGDGTYIGRSEYDAEGIDNGVIITSKTELKPGQFVRVLVTDAFDYDLCGEVI